ncbi:BT_3928 family protein [Odoribacter lunatus]|uniref:BT_3928 family protein n=1 Tax=Odoribacter lunatus TaxID=2941335 RepID=UPI0020407F78|nr:BT_3928 family protein [Odoribacter lunatus]
MKILMNICRILVGIVFIFSGFVKGVDPLGSNYKFIDYFNAFGMGWMNFSALFFSFVLSLAEFLIGICLFLNIKTKWAAWGALFFMAIFTPLTLVLAIKNPVTDCGCFGDAWVLSNWETFWKNVVLLAMVLIIFFKRERYKSIFNFLEQTVLLVGTIIFMLCIEFYCYRHLPILDFRPYAIGKNIPEGMVVPEGAPRDEYKITLNYKNKNTGEVKEFDETNYPWQDTLNWEFHSSEQKLIKEGFKAPIHDFVMEHPSLGDITDEVLEDENYTFLVVAYNLDKVSTDNLDKLNELSAYAREKGYRFYGLTASNSDKIQQLASLYHIPYEFCSMDEIQLKTIVRSNPGLVLLKKGSVINKWGDRDIPELDVFRDKDLLAYSLNEHRNTTDKYVVYTLILLYLSVLFLYMIRKYKKAKV